MGEICSPRTEVTTFFCNFIETLLKDQVAGRMDGMCLQYS